MYKVKYVKEVFHFALTLLSFINQMKNIEKPCSHVILYVILLSFIISDVTSYLQNKDSLNLIIYQALIGKRA